MFGWIKKKLKESDEKKKQHFVEALTKLSFDQLWALRAVFEKDKIVARPHTHDLVPCMVCGQFRICVMVYPASVQDFKRMLICDECMERELTNWYVQTSSVTGPVSETGDLGMESPEQYLERKCVRI